MELLKLNASLFYINDGEEYYILAEDEQQAREFYENEDNDIISEEYKQEMLQDNNTDNIQECYTIEELTKDTENEINIEDNEELCYILGRRYVNIYAYTMYCVVEDIMQYKKIELPMIIASSSF